MKRIFSPLLKLKNSEKGATAIEYALIAALISVVIILAVTFIGEQLNKTFSTVGSSLGTANL